MRSNIAIIPGTLAVMRGHRNALTEMRVKNRDAFSEIMRADKDEKPHKESETGDRWSAGDGPIKTKLKGLRQVELTNVEMLSGLRAEDPVQWSKANGGIGSAEEAKARAIGE